MLLFSLPSLYLYAYPFCIFLTYVSNVSRYFYILIRLYIFYMYIHKYVSLLYSIFHSIYVHMSFISFAYVDNFCGNKYICVCTLGSWPYLHLIDMCLCLLIYPAHTDVVCMYIYTQIYLKSDIHKSTHIHTTCIYVHVIFTHFFHSSTPHTHSQKYT